MTTERDELADVFTGHPVGFGPTPAKLMRGHAQEMADAILAAGYRKSPTSEEDIERAAKAVYNLDGRAGAWETRDEEIRELYREDARAVAAALGFPATVLHEPDPQP